MNTLHKKLLLIIMLLGIGCEQHPETAAVDDSSQNPSTGRWYSESQVALGATVFEQNCARCHGAQAEGTVADWKQRLPDGSFPPPPLNGSAHAWHHPRSVLLQVIDNGGIDLGGTMPGFASTLDQEEKLAAVAYFQSFWNDEIYEHWLQRGGTN